MKKLLFLLSIISVFSADAQLRISAPVYIDEVQTLINKSIDAGDNTITNIDNSSIASGAAIAVNKLFALTPSRLMATDGSGFMSASSVTATEAGRLSGVTAAIQTQIDSKLTKAGDAGPVTTGTNDATDFIFETNNSARWTIGGSTGYLRRGSGTSDFGFQLYGTGAGSTIAFGDNFDATTPYGMLREFSGTDTDQGELYFQKGLGMRAGTFGSTTPQVWITQAGAVCLNTQTPVSGAEVTVNGDQDISGFLNVGAFVKYKTASTPSAPANGTEFNLYYKANKLIIQYNDGGTTRYKYLDLTGTGVTWVQTTSAP